MFQFLFSQHLEFPSSRKWLFDILFYGPVNPLRSCWSRSVNLSTLFLGRLPTRLTSTKCPVAYNCPSWISGSGKMAIEIISWPNESTHEILALFVLHKFILQICMRSHPVGLDVWFLVWPFFYFHSSCVRTVKAQARLHGCAGSPEPSLVAYTISTIISWAGSNMWPDQGSNMWPMDYKSNWGLALGNEF